MLTGPDFITFVTEKLEEHGVEKVIPDEETLREAWTRAQLAQRVNELIEAIQPDGAGSSSTEIDAERFLQDVPEVPADLADQIRTEFEVDLTQSWDEALWDLTENGA